ncbi:Phytochrome, two-component sensor histidine kinase [Acidisarcina polymorpha]|uniref:histidine kinase n=1 Tax=Acidisarcina polymorpha TaxID=2211140 RepID=A0A2Z5FY51_9BACT|nr:ATP-binding protein [Acidisarcina polymorpha]AXC11397.1 Phytochrome, two-component sensor histidine kinase [Acidisarcina polymorpha]
MRTEELSVRDSLNILIVDDDEGDRKQIRRALKQTEAVCFESASVGEALEACEKKTFDCAIVDYRLAGQDGLSGIRLLHKRFPHLALIMITGQGDELVAAEAMKVGAMDYLSKNRVHAESLWRSVENAVHKATLLKKLDEQRGELEVFSRVLVHDLKGPLENLLLLAFLIEDNLREGISKGFPPGRLEEIASYCPALSRSVERMNALLDTLYKYTNAQTEVEFKPLPMGEVMIDALVNLKQLIQTRGAQVTYGELPTVFGSPQLVQLLQNLIANGIKYCDAETPLVHVSATALQSGLWQFAVQDNGIGIPEQSYQQIFEPFRRLHGIGKYEGSGLGLATCKKIVERHHGTIWCESKIGQGTTFCFTLPEWKPNVESADQHEQSLKMGDS